MRHRACHHPACGLSAAVTVLTCRWCLQLATGTVRATGGGLKPSGLVPHCDRHWEDAYRLAVKYPSRDWVALKPPDTLF